MSVLAKKDSELERLRLVHQKTLSARDRQIRSLQADLDSLGSQLSDRMRQVQVVQEAGQLKDQHIQLLKNIVSHFVPSPVYNTFLAFHLNMRGLVCGLKSFTRSPSAIFLMGKGEASYACIVCLG